MGFVEKSQNIWIGDESIKKSMDDMHYRRGEIGYLDLCNKIILVDSFVFY